MFGITVQRCKSESVSQSELIPLLGRNDRHAASQPQHQLSLITNQANNACTQAHATTLQYLEYYSTSFLFSNFSFPISFTN